MRGYRYRWLWIAVGVLLIALAVTSGELGWMEVLQFYSGIILVALYWPVHGGRPHDRR